MIRFIFPLSSLDSLWRWFWWQMLPSRCPKSLQFVLLIKLGPISWEICHCPKDQHWPTRRVRNELCAFLTLCHCYPVNNSHPPLFMSTTYLPIELHQSVRLRELGCGRQSRLVFFSKNDTMFLPSANHPCSWSVPCCKEERRRKKKEEEEEEETSFTTSFFDLFFFKPALPLQQTTTTRQPPRCLPPVLPHLMSLEISATRTCSR